MVIIILSGYILSQWYSFPAMNSRIIKGRLLCVLCFMSFLEYSRYNCGDREPVTGSEVIMVIGRIKLFKSFSCLLYPMGLRMSHNDNNETSDLSNVSFILSNIRVNSYYNM